MEIKFDPSDYLPRRTSRVSAHAASEAIKSCMKIEKTGSSNSVNSIDVSKHRKKASHPLKTQPTKRNSVLKCQNDCFIKLVRCDDDPQLKSMTEHLNKIKSSSNQIECVDVENLEDGDSDSDCICIEDESSPAWTDKKVTKTFNGKSYLDFETTNSKSRVQAAAQSTNSQDMPDVIWVMSEHGGIVNSGVGHAKHNYNVTNRSLQDSGALVTLTSGGKFELRCKLCPQTYFLAKDLVRHKHEVHNCTKYMCEDCSEDFLLIADLTKHRCRARYRCEACGVLCRQPQHLAQHKTMVHKNKKEMEYICFGCFFKGSSQEELEGHQCARTSSETFMHPKAAAAKKSRTCETESEPVLPVSFGVDIHTGSIYDDDKSDSVSDSTGLHFLCEVCLHMYPSHRALEEHKCDQLSENVVPSVSSFPALDNMPNPSVSCMPNPVAVTTNLSSVSGSNPANVFPKLSKTDVSSPHKASRSNTNSTNSSMAMSLNSVSMELLPQVEQLAKFYTSLVYKK